MTLLELQTMMEELRRVFSIVRLVDIKRAKCIFMLETGECMEEPGACYDIWNKQSHCENCVAMKALAQKTSLNTIELINGEAYFVMAKYIMADGKPYILEIINSFTDEALLDEINKNPSGTDAGANSKRYIDVQTGAYNRRYLDEQILALDNYAAIAKITLDDYETISETYGHITGDNALTAVADVVLHSIRNMDTLIRYNTDQFLLLFRNIPGDVFPVRLEGMRKSVAATHVENHSRLKLTVSIGGVFCPGKSLRTLMDTADVALEKAKADKNSVVIMKDTDAVSVE